MLYIVMEFFSTVLGKAYDLTDVIVGLVPTTLKSTIDLKSKQQYDRYELFLSDANFDSIASCIHKKNIANGRVSNYKEIRAKIPKLAEKWSKDQNLDDYQVLGPEPITDFLIIANRNFMKEHSYLFAIKVSTDSNPVRQTIDGKKPSEMLVDDFNRIDYQQPEDIIVTDEVMRYGNKFPIWQQNRGRHFDKSNEGLHAYNPDDASLVNPIYGFDMSEIHRRTDPKNDGEYRSFPFPYS